MCGNLPSSPDSTSPQDLIIKVRTEKMSPLRRRMDGTISASGGLVHSVKGIEVICSFSSSRTRAAHSCTTLTPPTLITYSMVNQVMR